MRITVINGAQNKGCTCKMKDMFLGALGGGHEITEYHLPRDMPEFCAGCKTCFHSDISACPHREHTVPIWDSIKKSELIVITSPVYVLRATGQVKALLDHYASKFMAHSPDSELFAKKAVVITNSAGAGTKNVVKDIGTSLDWWGVARRYSIGQALFYTEWDKVGDKAKSGIKRQCLRVAGKARRPVGKPRLKIRALFRMMAVAHRMINRRLARAGDPETKDFRYWKGKGWLNGGKPW